MPQLFDADGNSVEVMGEEEITALQTKAEESSKKAEELEATLKAKEEQLTKYSDKEFNFKQFRESEEAKRSEMLEGFTTKEQTLIKEIEGMRTRQDEADTRYFGQAREHAIKELAGDDKELEAILEDAVKESVAYLGDPKTAEEVITRYERAYNHIMGNPRTINPLNRFSPATGQVTQPGGTSFADTPDGKNIIETKFAKEIAKVKAKNPDFKL